MNGNELNHARGHLFEESILLDMQNGCSIRKAAKENGGVLDGYAYKSTYPG